MILRNKQNGFSLIEVLVAIPLVVVVGVGAFAGVSSAIKARHIADVRTNEVTIAETIMETVKGSSTKYIFADNGSGSFLADYTDTLDLTSILGDGYEVYCKNNSSTDDIATWTAGKVYGLPWNIETNQPINDEANHIDFGIQKITILITDNKDSTFRLSDFKVNR